MSGAADFSIFHLMRQILPFLCILLLFSTCTFALQSWSPTDFNDTLTESWIRRFKHQVLRDRQPIPPDFATLERIRFYAALCLQPKMKPEPARVCGSHRRVTTVERGRIQFVAYTDDAGHYVVVFRPMVIGSMRNFWTVWQLATSRCNIGRGRCGRVHRGFQKAYLHIKPKLMDILRDAKSVRFTGHSLGAAIAMLAAYDVHESNRGRRTDLTVVDVQGTHHEVWKVPKVPMLEVVVFGSPRVGNYDFEYAFEQAQIRHLRIVTTVGVTPDPISVAPPIFVGYSDPFQQPYLIKSKSKMGVHNGVNYLQSLQAIGAASRLRCPTDQKTGE
jgi:hypothetical protein